MRYSRSLVVTGLVLLAGGGVWAALRGHTGAAGFETALVDRGEVAEIVGATGVLQAVTTVQVGSQVSGTIAALGADFNSVVSKGQVIARLDPSSFDARVAQMRANVVAARAQVERSRAVIADLQQKYERARRLADDRLLAETDLQSAQSAYDGAVAQSKSDQAAIEQTEAALNQAELDLSHTVIRAPIDGVVLARNVDVGQTVAASLQAPTLFVIANDLTRMQVNAGIDEADIGRVRVGQAVSFRVDAYPGTFTGSVEQVRLQPVTTQNVVTYNTLVAVENKDQRLMPGMTATLTIVSDSRPAVLRAPVAALRFRPEGYEEPAAAPRRAPGERGAGGGGQRGAGSRGTGSGGPGGRAPGASVEPPGDGAPTQSGGGRPGLVFVLGPDGRPAARPVRLGLSDGRRVEITDGLEEGAAVIVGLSEPGRPSTRNAASTNPFSPQRPQPRTR